MSRDISTTNLAEINADHLHVVQLAKLEFDTPIYVHSGIGTITYDSNDYLGVGDLGSISDAGESEALGPQPLRLSLSNVPAAHISEALDSGNYGDVVTVFEGYRQDDGTLVDDPAVVWKGTFETAGISLGEENSVSITCQHDLAVLSKKSGDRFTDEDQVAKFAGDEGFSYVHAMATWKGKWAGGYGAAAPSGTPTTDPFDPFDNPTPWRP